SGPARDSARRPGRLRGFLVVTQLALSVVLLVGGTLFVRSLFVARGLDIGFDPRDRAMMSVNVGLQGYDETKGRRFYDEVLARTRALPAVVSAAWRYTSMARPRNRRTARTVWTSATSPRTSCRRSACTCRTAASSRPRIR